MKDVEIANFGAISNKEFGEQYSEGILLTDYPLTISYNNVSMEDADKNWHTPSVVLFSSEDGRVGGRGYKEYCLTRSDAYGIRTMADAYQYESQHLSEWNTWEEWIDRNKKGTKCNVMAVRYKQYVMIRLENSGVVISSTTTLPEDAGENIYFAFTGEHCTLSDFVPMRDSEPIGEGAITPASLEKPILPEANGDIPNLDCPGWWTAHTEGIQITKDPVHITFDSVSYKQAKENWHTPFIVLFSALDKEVNGIAYTEYSVTRSDAYGWKEKADTFSCEAEFSADWTSWEDWLRANKRGVKCSVTAVREDDTIILTQENSGVLVTTYMDVPLDSTLPICLSISGELCSIGNIQVNR